MTASQKDRDYIVAVNWRAVESAAKAGKGTMIDGVRVLDPKEIEGSVFLLPVAKSPHGVDVSPDGKYIIGSGKLQSITTVFNIEKIKTAADKKVFSGTEDGIPVLNYEAIKDAEVNVGLGPLHTQFDDQGNAYTSLFVESAVAKWKLGTWDVRVVRNLPPSMGSEDFAFMLHDRPGCYVRLGQGGAEGGCWLHNSRYDFNDAVIPLGAGYLAALAERRMPIAPK